MSYLARLKAEQSGKVVTLGTDKGDKSPSVSFVSSQSERFSEKGALQPTTKQATELRELLAWLRNTELDRWTDADMNEAIEVGSRDIEAALISFRALKDEKLGTSPGTQKQTATANNAISTIEKPIMTRPKEAL